MTWIACPMCRTGLSGLPCICPGPGWSQNTTQTVPAKDDARLDDIAKSALHAASTVGPVGHLRAEVERRLDEIDRKLQALAEERPDPHGLFEHELRLHLAAAEQDAKDGCSPPRLAQRLAALESRAKTLWRPGYTPHPNRLGACEHQADRDCRALAAGLRGVCIMMAEMGPNWAPWGRWLLDQARGDLRWPWEMGGGG